MNRCCCLAFMLAIAAMGTGRADAAQLDLGNRYGELIERGDITVHVYEDWQESLECAFAAPLVRSGRHYRLTVRRSATPRAPGECTTLSQSLGSLDAGAHRVTVNVLAAATDQVVQRIDREFRVLPVEGRCNALPELVPQVLARLRSQTGAQFKARVESDAEYAASMGFPVIGTVLGCGRRPPYVVAYRFTGLPDVGPSTHVFTTDREECYVVNRAGPWLFEGLPFFATPTQVDGSCARAGEIALYRVWKPFGVSNHRFTLDRAVVDEMAARGWLDEGPVMCVMRP